MGDFTNWLITIYQSYGFRALIVIVLTIVLTNIIKGPIVKGAEKYALAYSVDKSVITKWIAVIPYALSFVFNLIVIIIIAAVNKNWAIAWDKYIADSALFATLAIAGFEIGKKCIESYASKKQSKGGK